MNDLLKETRPSIEYLRSMLVRATYSSEPHIKELSYIEVEKALNHYEELIKKEEGVKPIKTYKRIGSAGECVEETYNAYECECGYTLCDDYAGTLELPNYCEKCGAKIKRSDTQ